MLTKVRSGLTYANVTATLALFIALGGGAYAAFKLPSNSVGAKQIKAGAVRSAKVKDGSLLAGDFKPGQLPAGQKGDKGDPGAPADVTTMFANVTENGHLVGGAHAVSASVAGGLYFVTFDRSVQACAGVANAGWTPGITDGGTAYSGLNQVDTEASLSGGNNVVRVSNDAPDGNARPTNFHLIVTC
ncbi:MAG: hypothetical protein QOG63_111 [Thermoleophilaceae bacterium]|nr:hypothetical protein [Thermoleophilaceae bacterium]